MNARQQRLGEIVHRLLTEASTHERRNRLVLVVFVARHNHLADHPQFAAQREERRVRQRAHAQRKAEKRPFGERVKTSVAQDVGGARHKRGQQAIADSELTAERDRGGLLHEHRIGSAIDDPSIESIAAYHTAQTIGGLEQADADAAPLQLVCGREARDASADNGHVEDATVHASMFSLLRSCSVSMFGSLREHRT
jgi:hypothetical protein